MINQSIDRCPIAASRAFEAVLPARARSASSPPGGLVLDAPLMPRSLAFSLRAALSADRQTAGRQAGRQTTSRQAAAAADRDGMAVGDDAADFEMRFCEGYSSSAWPPAAPLRMASSLAWEGWRHGLAGWLDARVHPSVWPDGWMDACSPPAADGLLPPCLHRSSILDAQCAPPPPPRRPFPSRSSPPSRPPPSLPSCLTHPLTHCLPGPLSE